MRRLIIFALTVLLAAKVTAQTISVFNPRDLNVSWQAVQNNYQGKPQSLNYLIVTNSGKTAMPASGWTIYFNSARGVTSQAVSPIVSFSKLNGDLFSIKPTGNFTTLKPGAADTMAFVSDELVINISDAPEGPYLVWDAQPGKGYATGAFTIKPFSPDYPGLVTPEVIYNQNKTITDVPEGQLIKVFPTPVSYAETGGHFIISSKTRYKADPQFKNELNSFRHFPETGKDFSSNSKSGVILLKFKAGLNTEGYELSVKKDSIIIRASTSAGIFYGIQSLTTLINPADFLTLNRFTKIPCVEIKDEPRFPYRAFLLDVARNFETKHQVLKLLDAMALYKLNVLHLHLTDDEGWRIALPSLPELTSVGSQRGHTLDSKNFLPASHGSGPVTGRFPGSGYYSRADYIDILKYAAERHIMVVPEIETPGHARAAIKAMDARYRRLLSEGKSVEAEKFMLHDLKDSSVYESVQYWNDNVIDVALPSTYTFFNTVINDIVNLYAEAGAPLKTIHFGGDEVPAHVWERSPAYLALKVAHPEIKSTGDLWYYFYGRINQMLKAKGLYLSGWEEMGLRKTLLDGKPDYIPNPDFTAEHLQTEVWNNSIGDGQEDLAYKLANAGYKVVLSSVTNLYFDMAHYKSFDEPGYYWGAFVDVDKPFSFIPYDYFKNTTVDKNGLPLKKNIFVGKQRLTDYGKGNIIGLQGCLWGENIKNPERMEYMAFPSILGLAERAWAADPQWAAEPDTAKSRLLYQQAWSNFVNVLGKRELPRLTWLNGGYNYRIPKPGVFLQEGEYKANMQIPGFTIRYTTDGRDPDAGSPIYKDDVTNTGKPVKFRAFDNKGRGSNVSIPVISN